MKDNTTGLESQSAGKPRRFNWPRVFGYDFFISFKLGSPPIGAQSYASDLARRLRELDFTVFFSEEEAPPGQKLDATLVKALRRSRILVVVANEGALAQSLWVRKEVEEFRRKHPKRPVIPINVDRAIEKHGPQVEADKWLDHEGRIWLDETAQAVHEGIASSEVLRRLLLAPRFIKANVLFRWVVATIIAVLIVLGSYAWIKKDESHQRLVDYNLSQGRTALTSGRALEAAPSLLRAFKEGADTPALRFMLARAFTSVDALIAGLDANALAFSSDGAQFAVALADGTIQVWSVPKRKIVSSLQEKLRGARALVFAPDGRSLAITAGKVYESGASQTDSEKETACAIGERVSDPFVTYWEVRSGALLHKFEPLGIGGCWQAFFSDNGRNLTIAGWTTQWTDLYWSMTKFDTATYDAVSATKPDSTSRCREFPKDDVMKMMNQEGAGGDCPGKVVAISSDGALVALAPWGFPQRELTVWDVRHGAEQTLSLGHDTEITGAAFSSDNERIAIAQAEGIEIWDVRARRKLLSVSLDAAWLPAEFSPEGNRLVAVTGQRSAAVFHAVDGHRLTLLAGHTARIRVATFSPDGEHILTAGDDGMAKVWDAWNGKLLITLEGHREPIIRAAFSPDLRFIVTRDQEGHVKIWNGRPLATPRILRDDPARVRWWSDAEYELADWSPDGNKVLLKHRDLWATNDENVFTLWNTRAGILTGLWRTSKQPILRSDKTTVDPADHDVTKPAPCPSETNGSEPVEPLALDYAGDRVVVGGGGSASRVAFLQAKASGCRKIPLEGHHSKITAAAFSPDDNFILTADVAGVVMVWDAANVSLLAVLAGEERPKKASFLPGGRALTLHERNRAVVWDLSLERRPITELQRIIACSGIVPSDTIADLVLGGAPKCAPGIRLPEPVESANSFDAAGAFLVSGWARENDRVWAERQLLAASKLYQKLGDSFGEAVCHVAIRAVAIAAGNTVQAEGEAKLVRELMLGLSNAEDQQARLTRLGEIAFNEFGDAEMARFAFAQVLERMPQDPAARLGAWETSPSVERPKDWLKAVSRDDGSDWSGSLRALVIQWVAINLAGQNTEGSAPAVWDMYAAGTTINPIFERLDFRGLRRVIAGAQFPKERQRQTLSVLEKLELPGDHANELKRLLRVPEDSEAVGP